MSEDLKDAIAPAPLLRWWGLYFGGWLVLLLTVMVGARIGLPGLPFFTYFAIGFALNRLIVRQLEFHPIHNTIGNVASAKLWSFLLWPVSYFGLLARLVIIRVL
ncbi:MAG: hypothetical protein H7Y60_07735 [Rhodospirillaceae bacterium]|nr:hypothetical protein [Rhodospirillales bacterium]